MQAVSTIGSMRKSLHVPQLPPQPAQPSAAGPKSISPGQALSSLSTLHPIGGSVNVNLAAAKALPSTGEQLLET